MCDNLILREKDRLSLRYASLYSFPGPYPAPGLPCSAGSVPYGGVRYCVVPYGASWITLVPAGAVRCHMVPYGAVWLMVGAIWFHMVLYGKVQCHMVMCGALAMWVMIPSRMRCVKS